MHIQENTQACMHMLTHNHIHLPVHAHICTHRGTSVQRTPSILNPDPGLHSVFTWKWSTTICGPSRLLCTSSRLGLGKRTASQMGGTTSDGLPCLWSQTLWREGKRGREEAACLAATETAGTPTYHGSGPWFGLHLWLESRGKTRTKQKAFLSVSATTAGAL